MQEWRTGSGEEALRHIGGTLIPEIDKQTEALPPGRYHATQAEVEAVFLTSQRRKELWQEWQDATALLNSAVEIATAWLGGSFFTSKEEPGDIDCVYWVDAAHLANLGQDDQTIVEAFAGGGSLEALGFRVDAYLVPWVSNPTPIPRGVDDRAYYQGRGYWDDLWAKMRSGAKNSQPSRLDSYPRRGYVEVTIDGYGK